MKRFRLLAMAIAILAMACDPAASESNTYFGLSFPDQIGGARLIDIIDFETDDPGLGYGAGYARPDWKINVYIYDLGLKAIPDDLQAPMVQDHFAQVKDDIFELERRGFYARMTPKETFSIAGPDGQTRLSCMAFTFEHAQRGNVDSFLCLAPWNNKFLKFRMTAPVRAESSSEARAFLTAWRDLLWSGR